MRLRADGQPDRRVPAVEQAVSAFKSETAELHLVPVVKSTHPGNGGVIGDGADLEAKILKRGELRPELACQHRIRPVSLAESTDGFRFDFPLSQLSHIGTLCKAEDELRIDIASTRHGRL
jgi:hypothetical protein